MRTNEVIKLLADDRSVDESFRLSFHFVSLFAFERAQSFEVSLESSLRVGQRVVLQEVRRVLHRLHVNAVLVTF